MSKRKNKDKETILNKMLAKSYQLKAEVDAATTELKEINDAIIKMAEFIDSNTAHLESEDFTATITKRLKSEWDQELLDKAKDELTEKEHDALFVMEVKPVSKKAIDEYIATGTKAAKLIDKARSFKEERPTVKITKKDI